MSKDNYPPDILKNYCKLNELSVHSYDLKRNSVIYYLSKIKKKNSIIFVGKQIIGDSKILNDKIEHWFNIELVSLMLMVTGLFLFTTKFSNVSTSIIPKIAFIIGLFQILALFPGISRSGITISTALLLGINRTESAKFSFFMAIPILIGAMILQIPYLLNINYNMYLPLTLGFISSALSGYFVMKWLIKLITENHFWKFSIYCWLLSIAINFII